MTTNGPYCAYCEEPLAGSEHARLHIRRCHPETVGKGAMLHTGEYGAAMLTVQIWPASMRAQEGFGMYVTVRDN